MGISACKNMINICGDDRIEDKYNEIKINDVFDRPEEAVNTIKYYGYIHGFEFVCQDSMKKVDKRMRFWCHKHPLHHENRRDAPT